MAYRKDRYIVSVKGVEYKLDTDKVDQLDLVSISTDEIHILFGHGSYDIHLDSINKQDKTVKLDVNGRNFEVKITDPYDMLVKEMGLDKTSTSRSGSIVAPMPGLVLKILVNQGDSVAKGDHLMILEAMKMENVIKAAHKGIIKTIHVDHGTSVDKGALLIETD